MPLSPPAPRQPWHTRKLTFEGFKRDDGLWDVEGELIDTKPREISTTERGLLPAHTPLHHMRARITFDDDLTVARIEASMESTPFPECPGSLHNLQKLVGVRASNGWRHAIQDAMGRTEGCTHMRELLVNLATVAYQTRSGRKRVSPDGALQPITAPLPHMGQCTGWDFDGEVMKRHYPQFHGWRKPG
ncbi:MAG: DUF2889 domain-containing protein [Pseudomonadota bacterium]